jgi:hypothetical protein
MPAFIVPFASFPITKPVKIALINNNKKDKNL